jgi:hypothetical protein
MVGVTYRSSSCRPSTSKLPNPPPAAAQPTAQSKPAPTFRDKESYSELFKPLPKPEAIPTFGGGLRVDAKPWRQLQEEREALMTKEIEKTKCEAVSMWDRAKAEDSKRVNAITTEKQRIEEEARKRDEIMAAGNVERLEKDKQRKQEIHRQEQLLSGRIQRAKTEEQGDPSGRGPGIQIYHYKDPEVEQIVKNTKKEEIRRRMSHGELLRSFNNGNGMNTSGSNNGFNNGFNNGSNNGSFNGSDVQSTNGEEEKTVFFDAQVMLRSQSSSSTTSR